jgi:hypothetical protein
MDDNRLSDTASRLAVACGTSSSRRTRAVRLGQAKRGCVELAAGGDLEFGKDPVEVVANGPVRDEQLLPDFSVGQPVGRPAGDLELLRRELIVKPANRGCAARRGELLCGGSALADNCPQEASRFRGFRRTGRRLPSGPAAGAPLAADPPQPPRPDLAFCPALRARPQSR